MNALELLLIKQLKQIGYHTIDDYRFMLKQYNDSIIVYHYVTILCDKIKIYSISNNKDYEYKLILFDLEYNYIIDAITGVLRNYDA